MPSTMLSSLLSPFQELDMDTNLSKEFMALLSEKRFNVIPAEELESTYSSCPINLNKNEKSREKLTEFSVESLERLWTCNNQLSVPNPLCRIPFLADRSVSMIEESKNIFSPPKPLSSRYKTELCRTFHEIGSCKYGSKCQFAHGSDELRGFIKSTKGQRPPLLRHSISCSGIPSSTSLDSLFSSSLSSFSPASPSFSPSASIFSSGPPSPTLNLTPFFHPASPPSPGIRSPMPVRELAQFPPYKKSEPSTRDCFLDKEISALKDCFLDKEISALKDCKENCSNSTEAKRLPIFSRLSD
uniref:mRNA decay activator protein ZFP36 n=1 Tax=Xenopus tropicalis TaxID=8364 RepID=A0A6I8PV41_XENTR